MTEVTLDLALDYCRSDGFLGIGPWFDVRTIGANKVRITMANPDTGEFLGAKTINLPKLERIIGRAAIRPTDIDAELQLYVCGEVIFG